jgi:hypothetical protein
MAAQMNTPKPPPRTSAQNLVEDVLKKIVDQPQDYQEFYQRTAGKVITDPTKAIRKLIRHVLHIRGVNNKPLTVKDAVADVRKIFKEGKGSQTPTTKEEMIRLVNRKLGFDRKIRPKGSSYKEMQQALQNRLDVAKKKSTPLQRGKGVADPRLSEGQGKQAAKESAIPRTPAPRTPANQSTRSTPKNTTVKRLREMSQGAKALREEMQKLAGEGTIKEADVKGAVGSIEKIRQNRATLQELLDELNQLPQQEKRIAGVKKVIQEYDELIQTYDKVVQKSGQTGGEVNTPAAPAKKAAAPNEGALANQEKRIKVLDEMTTDMRRQIKTKNIFMSMEELRKVVKRSDAMRAQIVEELEGMQALLKDDPSLQPEVDLLRRHLANEVLYVQAV